jgi:FAD/FMN-containing dehydrogenase/Fe-S oxidoreductase
VTGTSFVRSLRAELRGQVRDDGGFLAAYASDASNHRVLPTCVALPRDVDDIVRLVTRCADAGVPVTPRGAGTNVAGNAIGSGVVVDFSRHMTTVLEVDPAARLARVQPGVILDDLRARASVHGLTFGADPSSHNRCTIGGMIGTNACGSHSVAWGTTADAVDTLDVVLADGTQGSLGRPGAGEAPAAVLDALTGIRDEWMGDIRRELGRFRRQISGYGLQYLLPEKGFDVSRAFVGTEGTCGLLTAARVHLIPLPGSRALVIAGFPGEVAAAAAAPGLVALDPLTVEGMDDELVRAYDARPGPHGRPPLPEGRAWLLVELAGDDPTQARDRAEVVRRAALDLGALAACVLSDPGEQRTCWLIRERGAGLATRTADGREAWPGWEDAAVPPQRLADYLGDFRVLLTRYGRRGVVYGHFGEGCVHVRIDHDLLTDAGRRAYRSFHEDAADLVIAHGGSLSGEHGDGRARSELLTRMYGQRVRDAFAAFKHAFDPHGLLNPGILVDPRPLDADLRLALSRPHTGGLAFRYETDDGDIGKALRRCVGVGSCRKQSGGGMCPSYRATLDERHSTRGRARILFEMLDGSLAADRWRSADAKEALDLCLMCKACRSECPVTVDMATYKAEFLHQHYRGRLRPAAHYSMGWLPMWLALGRSAPRLANAALRLPGAESLVKRLGGIDPRRTLPRLACPPLRYRTREQPSRADADAVVLWVDTFTRSFEPEIARDAMLVLAAAGYRVELPARSLCCGLTWLSTGQLGVARRVMRRAVRALDRSGDDRPIVVLEPSCGAALRADVPELVGGDRARRVADRIRTLAEVMSGRDLPWAPAERVTALTQFHCHQRAVVGTSADRALLERAAVTVTSLDEGCCGLAGNFGFEAGHYAVSRTCAQQSFLPHLDRHDEAAPVLADGFSCRLQIADMGGRQALHLAQLLRQRIVTDVAAS